MNAASLHSTLFAGATEVEVGRRIGRLRLFNVAMGVVHAVQGAAILVLATSFTLPIVTYPLTGPPGSPAETITLFDLRIAWAVAMFLFISAIAHLVIASPTAFPTYERMLLNGRNYYRWVEYSLSASLMAVLIALLSGISDAAALIAIFGVNAAMILFGLLQEHYERPRWEHAAVLARLRDGCLWDLWIPGRVVGTVL
jgi:Heliorhodopsin